MVSHNAFSSIQQSNGWTSTAITALYHQQVLNLTLQLDAGARALMLDVHLVDDEGNRTLTLCHGRCTPLMYRNLTDTLIEVVSWLETPDHRHEIISIFIEDASGGDLNALYQESLSSSGALRLTIPSTDSRALPLVPFRGRVPPSHRYLTGTPRHDDTVEDLIASNRRLFFYVDRNIVNSTTTPQTAHTLPFVWHHFAESNHGNQDPLGWALSDPRGMVERGQSAARGTEAAPYRRNMTLVNHFGQTPGYLNPGMGSRDRIVTTVCDYFNQTGLPPRFIAVDDIVIGHGASQVSTELNSEVWNETDASAAMVRYCQRNNVNTGFGLLGVFPISLLIAFGIVAIVGVVFWSYRMFRRCCDGGRKEKKD